MVKSLQCGFSGAKLHEMSITDLGSVSERANKLFYRLGLGYELHTIDSLPIKYSRGANRSHGNKSKMFIYDRRGVGKKLNRLYECESGCEF